MKFLDDLLTGHYAILDQIIRCVEGLQFEACVPLYFLSQKGPFQERHQY
jgi:hypothetical protein